MTTAKKISKFFLLLVIFPVLLSVSVSCSRTKPEITFGFIKLILYERDSNSVPAEHFSLFIIPQDDDGPENLEELFIYHDKEQLRWHLKSDEWINYKHEGKDWIGTRSLASHDDVLPKGVFRVVLVNKGGESSERDFTFDGNVNYPFPQLEISSGIYTIISEWPVHYLVCYDRTGNYIETKDITSFSGSISELHLSQSVRTVALWADDEANFCSAFTNTVLLNK